MADPQDGKPRLPLTGLFALLAMVSSFLIYQEISLQTSRPVTKGSATRIIPEKNVVPARLWQDPLEALEAHRSSGTHTLPGDPHEIRNLIQSLQDAGLSSGVRSHLRLMPVFMDGSPYSSGTETRLNDRYAVISALGAAGYVPESGEHIRFFRWTRISADNISPGGRKKGTSAALTIPVELFISRTGLSNSANTSPEANNPGADSSREQRRVLILWLKNQDFSPHPLAMLNDLLGEFDLELKKQLPQLSLAHDVLGPRSSSGLSAMVTEINEICQALPKRPEKRYPSASPAMFGALGKTNFYSPWATAAEPFLLSQPPDPANIPASPVSPAGALTKKCTCPPGLTTENDMAAEGMVAQLFHCAGIGQFKRTIGTDLALAKELVKELIRRNADFTRCEKDGCDHKVALISEWDTLYGRALPRTFAAVAMTAAPVSGENGPTLEDAIGKLRRDEWPHWISHHSYLAGLDGELPAKGTDGDSQKQAAQAGDKPWYKSFTFDPEGGGGPLPEGRSQLDYLLRLAAALKQEEARDDRKFSAIGVLGSDVYDKLLILEALRRKFPAAIFFTTDLNSRLAVPTQWETTRNLVIASHFGLSLQPDLQQSIPPFRDSYQTSLFYSTLIALEHLRHFSGRQDRKRCVDCVEFAWPNSSHTPVNGLYMNTAPRLYEIGRQGPFDLSIDPVSTHPCPECAAPESIHPVRPDIAVFQDGQRMREQAVKIVAAAVILMLGSMLISATIACSAVRYVRTGVFLATLASIPISAWLLFEWMQNRIPNLAESEPFTLTDGISAWPTAILRLLALVTSAFFLWYIWQKMKVNEQALARKFDLEEGHEERNGHPQTRKTCTLPETGHAPPPHTGWRRAMRTCLGVHLWHPQSTPEIGAAQLWNEYRKLGQLKNFVARGIPQVIIALCFAGVIMLLFGLPNTPCRGTACFAINDGLILLGVAAMMTLIFYVVDATRLCRRWVNCIAMNRLRWSDTTRNRLASENGVRQEYLDEWLGIELIADRTTVIGNIIYYPFIVMFLIGIARHPYLDNWGFPASLVIIFALNASLVFINGMALRRAANIAKLQTIARLETRLAHLSDRTPDETRQKQQIEWSLRAIRNNRRGAFLPFTEHPVFGATIALPSGGYGLVLLLEYLATGL